jgi:hypothetical protein
MAAGGEPVTSAEVTMLVAEFLRSQGYAARRARTSAELN